MGLIKAGTGALGGALADSWREFFYCEALDTEALATKGQKRVGKRSTNTKGTDNIISNGSVIAVADGQCMIIVDQGKVVEICAEPGEFIYDTSTEPSIFYGNLNWEKIKNSFSTMGARFTFGGEPGKDQRIYYINTKEIIDNKFGTPTPVAFRVVDSKIGLDVDVSIRCNGIYSFKIEDPIIFYTKVCGNVTAEYQRSELSNQLKTEFVRALSPALGKLSELEIRPNQIVSHMAELEDAINLELAQKWGELRGLKVVSIAMNPPTLSPEDMEMIQNLQRTAVLTNTNMAAAHLVNAQAEAMQSAAKNEGGAMQGFLGMGMAMNGMGGMGAIQNLYAMNQQPQTQPQTSNPSVSQSASAWVCACGKVNDGKFCKECGMPKPQNNTWVCACGTTNDSKFCKNCGKPKMGFKCDKCGWVPPDMNDVPKFCPECGDIFNEKDRG